MKEAKSQVQKTYANNMLGDYALIDSGDGEKLERFGRMLIRRPASVAVWKRRLQPDEWDGAHAQYHPGSGWKCRKDSSNHEWPVTIAGVTLQLRLQTNGQVGVFPEHAMALHYIDEILDCGDKQGQAAYSMLNLFAYTGLASVYALQRGMKVCHVDLAKKALEWARENFERNSAPRDGVRLICDDAIKFLQREKKRGSSYSVLIVDPPSFSRVSKGKSWKLSEHLFETAADCASLLRKDNSLLLFSCHDPEVSAQMLENVLLDIAPRGATVVSQETSIPEYESPRAMPAGSLALLRIRRES